MKKSTDKVELNTIDDLHAWFNQPLTFVERFWFHWEMFLYRLRKLRGEMLYAHRCKSDRQEIQNL